MRHKKYILSISGQDPTNGAGNSLDILVANQHNFHCLSSITNLTIQDAEKLHKVEDVNENFFRKNLCLLFFFLSLLTLAYLYPCYCGIP